MKIYVINLDRSTDRLSQVDKQLVDLGLSYSRFSAIDAMKFTQDEITHYESLTSPINRLSIGDMACSLSHIECLKLIADSDEDYGAILEDDVILSSDAAYFLSTHAWVPKHTDVLKLETFRERTLLGQNIKKLPNNRNLFQLLSVHNGGAAYIVNRLAAREITKEYSFDKGVIDSFIFGRMLNHLSVGQLCPAIAMQSDATSNIAHTRSYVKPRNKLFREIERMFVQLFNLIKSVRLKLTKGQRWGKIPFVK